MSKIFELFGYRLDAWGAKADQNRANAWCPFMNEECDGGGNRYLSALDLKNNKRLAKYFPGKDIVQAGVCSLRVHEDEQPWIVCPRRLLTLRSRSDTGYQTYARRQVVKCSELQRGQRFRVWSEVKMKIETTTDDDEAKSFDYSFDYIVAGSNRLRLAEAASILGKSERITKALAESNGYTVAQRDSNLWIEDFPSDPLVIVEVMTSSTSGGDKKKRTQIGMAFEDAVINPSSHNGPGINYRQVWARMVSQLIVKSQVGMSWGGKTLWLLQDVLANYISTSTALDLSRYITEHPNEVNILALGYGEVDKPRKEPIIKLEESTFYSGPITENHGKHSVEGFIDIVKIGAPPPKEHLWRSLFKKIPSGQIQT